jgi:NitT/TauT family transport system permease protein
MSRLRGRLAVNRDGLSTVGLFVVSLGLLALAWQYGVQIFHIPEYLIPRFSTVVKTVVDQRTSLLHHTWITGYESVIGFAVALAVSIPLAILITYSKTVEKIVYPWLVSSQVVPKVAVAPLFVVWFGFGIRPKIIVAFLIAFFPIVVSTTVGLKSTEREMLYLARSMGGGDLVTFLRVRVPNAMPSIFGGLKVGITFSVVGALVGEFVGSSSGLGYVLLRATGVLDTPTVFASLVLMTILGVILFAAVEISERILVPWRVEERQAGATT